MGCTGTSSSSTGICLIGLRKAVDAQPDLAGVGIDSWAVDYGLVSGDRLINNPFHYRDERTARGVDLVHKIADHAALYATNGLQFQPFNSIYQLAVDHEAGVIDDTTRMLMIPDLLGFWLTGEQVAERTNASTTGLLDIINGSLECDLDRQSGPVALPVSPPWSIREPGSVRYATRWRPRSAQQLDVIAVGSHDTASAVVGVPMTEPGAAYVSSGTWSLVGVELDRPVLTEESREANFTNEGGVDGKIRYLRNVMGMWLLSESIRTWERAGQSVELTPLLEPGSRDQYAGADLRRQPSEPAAARRHAQAHCRTVRRSRCRCASIAGRVRPQHRGEPRRGICDGNRRRRAAERIQDQHCARCWWRKPEHAALPADGEPYGSAGIGWSGGGDCRRQRVDPGTGSRPREGRAPRTAGAGRQDLSASGVPAAEHAGQRLK